MWRGEDPTNLIQRWKGTSLRRVMQSQCGARVATPGSIQKRKVPSNPPQDSQGRSSLCYAGPLRRQAGAPSEAPRWVLSTWPEQDKEQYEQHMAQIQVPTHSTQVSASPQSSPHVMQRLAGKGCPGGYAEPEGRSGRGSPGPGGTAG